MGKVLVFAFAIFLYGLPWTSRHTFEPTKKQLAVKSEMLYQKSQQYVFVPSSGEVLLKPLQGENPESLFALETPEQQRIIDLIRRSMHPT